MTADKRLSWLVIAGVIAAIAIYASVNRYELQSVSSQGTYMYTQRLDRWTGDVCIQGWYYQNVMQIAVLNGAHVCKK